MNRELQTIIVEVEKAVVGKREVIEKILMALLAAGRYPRRRQNDAGCGPEPHTGPDL